MKNRLLLFFCVLFYCSSQAQLVKRYNRPFFGLNIGATYQQSDVRNIAHVGYGFTFGKYYLQNETRMFDLGWRFRYLYGTTSGMDSKPNHDIKNNPVLNHLNSNPELNYADSLGYVYNNYSMTLQEGALEVMVGCNKLRQKTRIVLYGFGGIGLSWWQTKMDQLDANKKRYTYAKIDSTSGKSSVLNQLNAIQDKSYETNADGNSTYKAHFVPSCGIGMGWQTRRGHYIGIEHRVTFTLYDYADGVPQSGGGMLKGNNDLYHYSGAFVKWMIGGKPHKNNPAPHAHTPPPSPNPAPPTPTTTVTNNPPPSSPKPIITISYPNTNPFTTSNEAITVSAKVLNVNSRNDISVSVNGTNNGSFKYDATTKMVSLALTLIPGTNTVTFNAKNSAGTDKKNTAINYSKPTGTPVQPVEKPPVVTITSPSPDPFTSITNKVTITASIQNVKSKNDIHVSFNGREITNLLYDATTKSLSFNVTLNAGDNSVSIQASNSSGSDSKSRKIKYTKPAGNEVGPGGPGNETEGQKPVITITNPSTNPATIKGNTPFNFTARVINVTSSSNISVSFNGYAVNNFSYDLNTKTLTFTAGFPVDKTSTITITATNDYGSDTKSTTVIGN